MNITVLGAGAWGTAFAVAVAPRQNVLLWGRESDLQDTAQTRKNPALPGVTLHENLIVTADFEQAVAHCGNAGGSILVVATPVSGLRDVAQRLRGRQIPNLIWLCKGFEAETGMMPHQIVTEVLGSRVAAGALSGPSFAQEVAAGLPCALTVASESPELQQLAVAAFNGGNMRVYTSDDVVGVEVGGAVKNILAIASGIADGLGMGMNARAALITRGLAEITRLGMALGGRPETFMGLTGMGDLILTCTGDLSRNRQVGLALAKGKSLDAIVAELGHVAEGVRCAQAVRELAAERGIDMPITNAVCGVLFDGVSILDMVAQLLSRHTKNEWEMCFHSPA